MAIEAIARNVPLWDPPPPAPGSELPSTGPGLEDDDYRLSFDSFDIDTVIKCGMPLLSSSGTEFEEVDYGNMDPKERIAHQKKLLKKQLGLETGIMERKFYISSMMLTNIHL